MYKMTGKLLSLPIVTKCLFYQKSTKLNIYDWNIPSQYSQHFCNILSFRNFESKSNSKKGKSTSSKINHVNKNGSPEKSSENMEEKRGSVIKKKLGAKEKKAKLKEDKIDLSSLNELQNDHRIKSFNHSLASYISVCVYCGFFTTAYDTLKYYKKFQSKTYCKTINLKPYNELLKGIANQGDVEKMREVLKDLIEASLKPDYNTIAYCLICLGRNGKMSSVNEIKHIFKLMNQHDITLDQIFGYASIPGDSFQYCLRAVERLMPNVKEELDVFKPTKDSLIKQNCYHNNLVNNLNDSLFMKQTKSPADGIFTQEELSELIKEQISMELKGYAEIPFHRESKITNESKKLEKLLNEWKKNWRKVLHETVTEHKKFMTQHSHPKGHEPMNYFPYISVLNTEDIVDILMHEVNNLCTISQEHSSSRNMLARNLGDEFYKRFQIKYKEKTQVLSSLTELYEDYCNWYLRPSYPDASRLPRVQWKTLQSKMIHKTNFKDTCVEWPYHVKLGVGRVLYNIIMSSVKIWSHEETEKDGSPAFYNIHRSYDVRTVEEIKPDPFLSEVYGNAYKKYMTFPLSMLPMLSPPVPWSDPNTGGYFIAQSEFVRLSYYAYQQRTAMKKGGVQKLYPAMDSLNALGVIPWKINHNILDIIIEIYNKGGSKEFGVPPPPSSLPDPPKVTSNMSLRERFQAYKITNQISNKKMELLFFLKQLSLVKHYRNSIIWLPYNMDFRGRVYPLSSYLNHYSTDILRSTLCFALGKKLGKEGISWLKLHIVNLTGLMKKRGLEDRFKFCEEVMDEIIDSAKNPLTGNKWWAKSDEPWQTLAACKDLVAALESECPEDYVSHIPIHQDGSCNGLQHYAALGRDKDGAASVNLCPLDTPQDAYLTIVDLVEERRAIDAEKGLMIAQKLKGFVTRKIIKQTVMTTVYGVTQHGARIQISKQLKDLDDFPEDLLFEASNYLTKQTFNSMRTLFSASKLIQDWLVKIAEGVSKSSLQNVEWETPLGLPVVQSYSKAMKTNIPFKNIVDSYKSDLFAYPNIAKQKNSFPANFIHSLDATHMKLSSLYCQQAGIAFVSVHDCFWTHASTVPLMNKICREEFVKLHSQPILEDLSKCMINKYSSHPKYNIKYESVGKEMKRIYILLDDVLRDIPAKGNFDINDVLRSVFFFS